MADADRPRSATRRSAPVLALAFGVVVAGGAAGAVASRPGADVGDRSADVVGRPSMDPDEIPAEVVAPARAGDGTVASFAAFLATVRSFSTGTPAPRPRDLAGLVEATSTSASGTVAAASLELGVDRVGDLEAARIDLIVDLHLDEVVEADARTGAARWVRTIWSGDPVLAEPLLARFRAELGEGPVGAGAVLFGNVVGTVDGPVLAAYDGLVEDATHRARVSLVLSEPDAVLSGVDRTVDELTS